MDEFKPDLRKLRECVISNISFDVTMRGKLSRKLGNGVGYLLQGSIQGHKTDDWVVLIPQKDGIILVADKPMRMPERGDSGYVEIEECNEISFDQESMGILFYILLERYGLKVAQKKNKGGRPKKYGSETTEQLVNLRAQGMSLRGIAQETGIPLSSAKKLLDEYDADRGTGARSKFPGQFTE